jgi:hypothetical protein
LLGRLEIVDHIVLENDFPLAFWDISVQFVMRASGTTRGGERILVPAAAVEPSVSSVPNIHWVDESNTSYPCSAGARPGSPPAGWVKDQFPMFAPEKF